MRRVLIPTAAFIRRAKRYAKKHPNLVETFRETLAILEADAYDPRLRTHR